MLAMPELPPCSRVALRYSVFRSPPDQKLASKSSEAALVRRISRRLVNMMLQDMLEVDPSGFDAMDRRLLQTIIEKFDGGPVGVESLSAAIGEERGTIEDVLEPYLIQQGFMMRTARGRVATRNAYLHFGLTPPLRDASPELPLFDKS